MLEADQIQGSRIDCCAHVNDHRTTFEVDHEMTVGIQLSCTVIQINQNDLRSMGLFNGVKRSSKVDTHRIIAGESRCLKRVDGRGGSGTVCLGAWNGTKSRVVIRCLRRGDGRESSGMVRLGRQNGTKSCDVIRCLRRGYRDYTRLRRGKKGNVISGRYALIGSWLVTKISQVCDKSSKSILQRVLSEGWSKGR